MTPKQFFFITGFLLTTVIAHTQLQRFSFSQPKMGSAFIIIFYDTDSINAGKKAEQCYLLVDSLVNILSDYLPESEVNRLCKKAGTGEWIKISPVLMEVMKHSLLAWKRSGGAFDVSIGPLSKLWRKARKEKIFPAPVAISEALKKVGAQNILLDTVHQQVKLVQPGMQLDFGGIGQGYIAQKVIEKLSAAGIKQALVNASGDIVLSGAPPGTPGWIVAVNPPRSGDDVLEKMIQAQNKSVITSGDVYQYIEKDGKRYSHIIDHRTGYGVQHQRNVTIITADGTTADWLATACSILSLKKAKRLARSQKAELLIAQWKNEKIVCYQTKGFSRYWKKSEQTFEQKK